MAYSRWRQLKGNMKLCLFYQEKKKGDDGYDPTIKYRKIWDVATYNLNQLIKRGVWTLLSMKQHGPMGLMLRFTAKSETSLELVKDDSILLLLTL